MSQLKKDITLFLNELADGDADQVEHIYPLVYEHLRDIAHNRLMGEREGHTLQTTELVHEAYLKLVDQKEANFNNRSHFLAIASMAMRRILISYARKKNAGKRGGKEIPVTFNDELVVEYADTEQLIDIDDALQKLEKMSEKQAKVVEYRFFGGLTYKQIAEAMGETEHSVRYDWRVARAWLKRELEENAGP